MRRYFDDDDEVSYYPPAWYLWPLWWLALPVLVVIDRVQCWIVSRNIRRKAKPGQPTDPVMDAILRSNYPPEFVEALAKPRPVSMLASLQRSGRDRKWVVPVDATDARLPDEDKDPDDGTD